MLSWSSKPRFQLGVKFNACREKKQPEENKKWEWRQHDFLHSPIITNEEDGENRITEEELETANIFQNEVTDFTWHLMVIEKWFSSHHHHGHLHLHCHLHSHHQLLHHHLLQFSVFVSIIKLVPSQSGYIRARIKMEELWTDSSIWCIFLYSVLFIYSIL